MKMLSQRCDVVVVGAGPTGLTLACTLRRPGVDVLILDRSIDSTATSRAAVLHVRTRELLEDLQVSP
ncbi:FAD-dependent oxidoreductase [Blastococcus sp. TF02A-35]|nr:FAD-dependent oxidoreductase [Blastococcus sp. TF02A_35]